MDLFEYQAQELFRATSLNVPAGEIVSTAEFIAGEYYTPSDFPVVVKAQVKVGGRGKAGGIKVVRDINEYKDALKDILGMKIKRHKVNRVFVVPAVKILSEFYCSIMFDRSEGDYILMLSLAGGMDIEKLAKKHPDKLIKLHFSPLTGVTSEIARSAVEKAGFDDELIDELIDVILKLWSVYQTNDATLVEVNPLALVEIDSKPQIYALDAKVTIDDNARFRQSELFGKYETNEGSNRLEVRAKNQGLAYVKLDGQVGIIGNGAGLVMSTLDLVSHFGVSQADEEPIKPANFLDIGGGASAEHMRKSLELVMSDKDVKSVLINVFGGLTQCSLVARGILGAILVMQSAGKEVLPIIVRLDGNEAELGLQILQDAKNPHIQAFNNQTEAAKVAIAVARERRSANA